MVKTVKKSFANVLGRAFSSAVSKDEAFWRPASQTYPRLTELDLSSVNFNEKGGVFAAWHLGVRPQWLKVGTSQNFAETFAALAAHDDVVAFDRNRGVFIAWAYSLPKSWAGQTKFLSDMLVPALQNLTFAAEMNVPEDTGSSECMLPPGTDD
jgi:hypothetical protein